MPRHRKKCVPQHRAQRREGRPGRGVPVSAATRPDVGRRLRGLLVTPWLAAGTGIVIAAAMANIDDDALQALLDALAAVSAAIAATPDTLPPVAPRRTPAQLRRT